MSLQIHQMGGEGHSPQSNQSGTRTLPLATINPPGVKMTQDQADRLIAAVERIAAVLERRAPSSLREVDVATLLAEIHRAAQSRPFTTAGLLENADLSGNTALAEAIVAVAGELSPRKLGHALRSASQDLFDGYGVQRLDYGRSGWTWRVVRQDMSKKTRDTAAG
jgi:hypothetical protein